MADDKTPILKGSAPPPPYDIQQMPSTYPPYQGPPYGSISAPANPPLPQTQQPTAYPPIPPGHYPPATSPPSAYPQQPSAYPPQPSAYPPQPSAYPPQPNTYPQQSYQQGTVVAASSRGLTINPSGVVVVGGCPSCRVGMLEDDYTCLGVCLAIVFFPMGILCCLALRERRCSVCGAIFG